MSAKLDTAISVLNYSPLFWFRSRRAQRKSDVNHYLSWVCIRGDLVRGLVALRPIRKRNRRAVIQDLSECRLQWNTCSRLWRNIS
ncbi:unnamed protein product [Nezara viridula]|uniref:Uncharacterized protein n=1 Tax=Nezara viridula TaxID=85310 RepID=A0A9P0HMP7_NEZVI|nr:unnamed protein product [Nezara viridula]